MNRYFSYSLRAACRLALLSLIGAPLTAAQLRITLESAPSPAGPWVTENPDHQAKDANGNPLLPMTDTRRFFRTRIETTNGEAGAPILLADVPKPLSQRAQAWLDASRATSEGWPGDAEIAPCVHPIFDYAVDGGRTPAYLEFKVARAAKSRLPGSFLNRPDDCRDEDLGFIILSLHEGDLPVTTSATEGLTKVEQLQCLAKNKLVKVYAFGGTFMTAEDNSGHVLATLGSAPFKVDPALALTLTTDKIWEGNDERAEDTRPLLPAVLSSFYATYEALQADYLANPVYVKLRQRKATSARARWDVEQGRFPTVIQLNIGATATAFAGLTVDEFHFDAAGRTGIAHFSSPTTGGILITADALGDGILTGMIAGAPRTVIVQVTAPGVAGVKAANGIHPLGPFVPGWQPWVTYVIPGGYAETPHYTQLKNPNWCPYVGCGPNAWAMLTAWYERHGVPAAFGNFISVDAPPSTKDWQLNGQLIPELDKLHDYCDVICTIFSDEGATTPGNQAEGILDYTGGARLFHFLNMGWKMRWSGLFSTFDGGPDECRDAVKQNHPSVVGLGEYWHYALVFGYKVREFKASANGPAFLREEYIDCNMGWGGGTANSQWWPWSDTFFSSNITMSKGSLSP